MSVVVDVPQSNYSAGLIIASGDPSSLEEITCGPGTVLFSATAGTTYSILAFDDQFDGGGNGGALSISISAAPDAPSLDVVLNPIGGFNAKTGAAILSGTFTCDNANFLDVFGELSQRVGRGTVNGFFFLSTETCDGIPQSWTAEVLPSNGKFAGGKSAAVAFSFACGQFQCADGYTEQKVLLRSGRR